MCSPARRADAKESPHRACHPVHKHFQPCPVVVLTDLPTSPTLPLCCNDRSCGLCVNQKFSAEGTFLERSAVEGAAKGWAVDQVCFV